MRHTLHAYASFFNYLSIRTKHPIISALNKSLGPQCCGRNARNPNVPALPLMSVNPGMLAEVFYSTLSFPLSSTIDTFESPVSTAISYPLPRSTRQLDLHWGDHCLSLLSHRQRKDHYRIGENHLTCPGCLIGLEILSEGAAILDDEWLCWDTDKNPLTPNSYLLSLFLVSKKATGKDCFFVLIIVLLIRRRAANITKKLADFVQNKDLIARIVTFSPIPTRAGFELQIRTYRYAHTYVFTSHSPFSFPPKLI